MVLFTRKLSTFLAAALALAVPIALAACGDGSGSEEAQEAEASVTPAQAIDEIAVVRSDLERALEQYRGGDATAAGATVEDAYLEHFELVEVPLGEADPELNEQLEELIREELRGEIDAGAPAREVTALVAEAQRALDEAERLLQSSG